MSLFFIRTYLISHAVSTFFQTLFDIVLRIAISPYDPFWCGLSVMRIILFRS